MVNKYIDTLDYETVVIRYDKRYVTDYVDTVEMVSGDIYDIYKNLNGELVAIKNVQLTEDNQ